MGAFKKTLAVVAGGLSIVAVGAGTLMAVPQTRKMIVDGIVEKTDKYQAVVEENNILKMNATELQTEKAELLDSVTEIDNKLAEETDEAKIQDLQNQKTAILEKVANIENRIEEIELNKNTYEVTKTVVDRTCINYLSNVAFDIENATDEELSTLGFLQTEEVQANNYTVTNLNMPDGNNKKIVAAELVKVSGSEPLGASKLNLKSMLLGLVESLNISITGDDLFINNITRDNYICVTADNLVVNVDGTKTTDYILKAVDNNGYRFVILVLNDSVDMAGYNVNYNEETKLVTIDIITEYEQLCPIASGTYEYVQDDYTYCYVIDKDNLTYEFRINGELSSSGSIVSLGNRILFKDTETDILATFEDDKLFVNCIDYTFVEDSTGVDTPNTDFDNPDEEL